MKREITIDWNNIATFAAEKKKKHEKINSSTTVRQCVASKGRAYRQYHKYHAVAGH